jgi:Transcription factor WhiB
MPVTSDRTSKKTCNRTSNRTYDVHDLTELLRWRDEAACRRYPNHWWLDVRDSELRENARRICTTECPVVGECEAYAVANHEIFGVWGGRDFEPPPRRARRDVVPRYVPLPAWATGELDDEREDG